MVERTRPVIRFPDQGRTRQEDAQDADINNIMRKFISGTGQPRIREGQPFYGDFTGPTEFLDIVQRANEAQQQFNSLPARVRSYCDNNVSTLLTLLEDPRECDKLRELGLEIEFPESPKAQPDQEETASKEAPISAETETLPSQPPEGEK